MDERIAVKYHERLVEALGAVTKRCIEWRIGSEDGDDSCDQCGEVDCGKARALLAEIE